MPSIHAGFSGFFRISGRLMGQKRLSLVALWIAALTPSLALALCIDISDVPMDTQLQAAPASIMFVIDDSGSMDWEFMTSEDSGIFHGEYYNFDLGAGTDNAYSDDYIVEGNEKRLWKGRWSGYNKMYYNPTANYTPWPGQPDADTTAPRSNPINASPTLDLTTEYDSIETGIVIDNVDAGFSKSSNGWSTSSSSYDYGSDYYYTYNNDGTAWAKWAPDIQTGGNGNYEVFVWYASGGTGNRRTDVSYTVYHNGVSDLVTGINQQQNQGQWNSLGTFYFLAGSAQWVRINANVSGDSGYCADAMKFAPTGASTVSIKNAHYYTYSDSEDTPYLIVLDGSIRYYRFTRNEDDVSAAGLVEDSTPPEDVKPKDDEGNERSYALELQNFANWFSFYRRRELTAKAAIANVIDGLSGVKVGFYSIHNRLNQAVLPVKVAEGGITQDDTNTLLTLLYGLDSDSSTPLREALRDVGYYFGDGGPHGSYDVIGSTPYAAEADGGACQQAFAIVVTDGFWNGSLSTTTGNEDGDQGAPYADAWTRTLADVAMRFYKNDLSSTLDDLVPTNFPDMATWQHMVTYGVSFGLTGTLDPDDFDLYNILPAQRVYPTWPDPTDTENSERIDDLWHASVNGRGMFLSASNPEELIESLEAIMQNVMARIGSGASISINGEELQAGSRVFQASYSTDNWAGDVKAYALNTTTGAVIRDNHLWSADEELEDVTYDNRIIATYNTATSAGIPFQYNQLSPAQQTLLNSDAAIAENILNYLRGDSANEEQNGGSFRTRSSNLGDIVHSSPTFFDDVIYAGANDGMMHAFDADNGRELFAYIPGQVFDNLANLSSPAYSHRYYVDMTPYVEDTGSGTLLVGGFGKGGKGYYCLDVTNAKTMTSESQLAANVKWEFPSGGSSDSDMGYSFSEAYIVQSNSGEWVVIFGNGYASANENAVLFVLRASDGVLLKKIDTGVGSCNGLSTPIPVDMNQDGKLDYVYAGDLKGNLWKFDCTADNPVDWEMAYGAEPLFQAKDSAGNSQAITTKPDVMFHCVPDMPGYMVITGTGKHLGNADFSDTQTQTIYGLWDYGDDVDENLGSFNHATGELSNQPATVTLLEQTEVYYGSPSNSNNTLRLLSQNEPEWIIEDGNLGAHAGWYFDLPIEKERIIRNFMIRDGKVIFISSIPKDSPCAAGGDSILHEMNTCSGGGSVPMPTSDTDGDGDIDLDDFAEDDLVLVADPDDDTKMVLMTPGTPRPQFDINGDGLIDLNDMIRITVTNPDGTGGDIDILVEPTGIMYPEMIYPPKIMRHPDDTETKYFSTAAGNIEMLREQGETRGIYYWRQRMGD
jgi:type IV pilus assembly protein PilY1